MTLINSRSYRALAYLIVLIATALASCRQAPQPPPPQITVTAAATAAEASTPTTAPTETAPTAEQPVQPTLPANGPSPTPLPTATASATVAALGPFADCPVPQHGAPDPGGPLSVLIFNDLGAWRWDDQSETATALPFPPEARWPLPSPDGDRIAYTLEPQEGNVELWVMNDDGGNQRLLATVSTSDYLAGSPEYIIDAALSYRWLADRELLAYEIVPVLGALGVPPLETLMVADINSGQTWTLLPGGEFIEVINHPEGYQIAALNGDELQLIDTATGDVQHEVALPLNDFWFSADYAPDGDSLAVFTEGGVALVDAASGEVQTVVLDYEPIGVGESALMPPIHWLPGGRAFYTIIADGTEDAPDIFSPQARFTVWRVDVAASVAEPLQTFTGSLFSVTFSPFSPDRRFLAFSRAQQDNVRTLYIADLASGEQVAYERLDLLQFLGWHPDSAQFVYWQFSQKMPLLGHVCRKATPLEGVTIPFAGAITWLGPDSFVSVEGVDRGNEVTGPWEIHMRTVGGADRLLHTVEGAAPQVRFGQ